MANFYSKEFSNTTELKPNRETIDFLLNYSRALSVINYKDIQFENILN
ncbi:hypothetical protein SAMN04487906_1997 [Zhouia amylolytica]|uniref:Uncharacterized protein n=2 Tax=Zhouia amylolytica TaxID=376730 RepID=W2USP0_9FLAO|nr:hypothetical protein P278_08330 [Zhouia amylolytica AD3]SFS87476.1 hypothetical protein SAMN04487906_1997 [Zhouia amylolytica]